MNPDQLWQATMDPNTRKLIEVKIGAAALAERRVSILVGDDPALRKEWIDENINFDFDDD